MELLIILAVIIVAVWYGLFRPVETAATVLKDEVEVLAATRKADHIKTLGAIDVSTESVTKAKTNIDLLRSIEL